MFILKKLIIGYKVSRFVWGLMKQWDKKGTSWLTEPRARRFRLESEKIAHALATGKLKNVPPWMQWMFKSVSCDNQLGRFMMWFLKSGKLEKNDAALNEKIYPVH